MPPSLAPEDKDEGKGKDKDKHAQQVHTLARRSNVHKSVAITRQLQTIIETKKYTKRKQTRIITKTNTNQLQTQSNCTRYAERYTLCGTVGTVANALHC